MDKKITFTLSSLFKGEGFDKAGQAVKGMSKSVKDTTQAVGQLAGEMGGLTGTAGKVADGIGKMMGALTGGPLTMAIASITAIVGLLSKWKDSIEETRKKNRQMIEEMQDGFTNKVAFAIDHARKKAEEFLNVVINKGNAAIEKLERMRSLARDMASARAGTQAAQDNLNAQRVLTGAERAKAGTTNQFTQREIDLNARQQLNSQNRGRLQREKKVQDEQLAADENLLKQKIEEYEFQKKNSIPQAQIQRRQTLQRQIDEKTRQMAVQQERINYYHDLNIDGEGNYDENKAAMDKAGKERVKLSQERLQLQEELAKFEKGDGAELVKIDEKIGKLRNDLQVIDEKKKASAINYQTEQEKLEAERLKIETDRNKLAEDRKKSEAESAKKAKEKADKEAKDRANAEANRIEAKGRETADKYQSREAQNIITSRAKIDALMAKRKGLTDPDEIAQWGKELANAQSGFKDAIKAGQKAVDEGKKEQAETKLLLTEERWRERLGDRDRLQQQLDKGGWTKQEREKLTREINLMNGQANRLRNDTLRQAAEITKNAKPDDKFDAITNELQLLKQVAQDIESDSQQIANNTRTNAANNLTGEQRKNNRNAAREQDLLNARVKRRQDAQNKAADRDIQNGGWFLDENGNLKSTKGGNAPHLSRGQRERLTNRLKQQRLDREQKQIQERIKQLQQQQEDAVKPIPQTLKEIKGLLSGNLNLLNAGMKAN